MANTRHNKPKPKTTKRKSNTRRINKKGGKTVKFSERLESPHSPLQHSPLSPEGEKEKDPIFNLPRCRSLSREENVYPCRIQRTVVDSAEEHRDLIMFLQSSVSTPEKKQKHYLKVQRELRLQELMNAPRKTKKRVTPSHDDVE